MFKVSTFYTIYLGFVLRSLPKSKRNAIESDLCEPTYFLIRYRLFSQCLEAEWLRSSRQLSDSSLHAGARVVADGAMTNCTIGAGGAGAGGGGVILVASAGARWPRSGSSSIDVASA